MLAPQIDIESVKRSDQAKGLVDLPELDVERTIAWRTGSPSKNRPNRADRSDLSGQVVAPCHPELQSPGTGRRTLG